MATNGQAIEIYQPDAQVGELKRWRAPEEVLIEAQQAAAALQKRIAGKLKPVIFNGQQYIENDDWQMLSHFFGYAPKVISTEFVEYGNVQGFKAIAELVNEHTGMVVSRGEALCLDEEDSWGDRTKYEWRDNGRGKREKVVVGTISTPLFQLASMAQTRACNKAMSNKLKWVVSLAGYATTPAEDMHEAAIPPQQSTVDDLPATIQRKQPSSAAASPAPKATTAPAAAGAARSVSTPAPAPQVQPRSPQPSREAVISEPQARRFYAIWKSAGKTKEQVNEYLHNVLGVQSDREMPSSRYTESCAWAERPTDAAGRW